MKTEIVLNADDAHAISLLAHRPDAYTFAHHETADLQCRNLDLSTGFPEFDIVLSARFKERTGADNLHVKVGVAGYHMVLKGFKLLGSKVAHRMEEKHFEPSSRQEYTAPYDHLELKNLSDYQQHQKPWKESEFVKSNLQ